MKKSRKVIIAIIVVLVVLGVSISAMRKARMGQKRIETVRIEKSRARGFN